MPTISNGKDKIMFLENAFFSTYIVASDLLFWGKAQGITVRNEEAKVLWVSLGKMPKPILVCPLGAPEVSSHHEHSP